MVSNQTIMLFLCTVSLTTIFSFIFLQINKLGQKIFYTNHNIVLNILLFVTIIFAFFCILVLAITHLLPDNIAASNAYSLYLSLSFFYWIVPNINIKNNKRYGTIIFKSNRWTDFYSNVFSSALLSIGFIGYPIFVEVYKIRNGIDINRKILGFNVDHYTFSLVMLIFLISTVSFLIRLSWCKLEIRKQGIIFLRQTYLVRWEDIISYSWLGKNLDLLEVECKLTNNKTRKYKIAVFDYEKEEIEAIFQDKITA